MYHLKILDERLPDNDYVEFMVGNEAFTSYNQPSSLYLPFSPYIDTEEILAVLEETLGFDYYGCQKVSPQYWSCFLEEVEQLEDSSKKGILEEIAEDLQDFVTDSIENFGYFYIVGL